MNTLLTIYLLASTIIIGFLFLIWKKSNWINMFIKMILFAAFVFGVIVNYNHFTK